VPTYDYRCGHCHHEVTGVDQRITDPPLVACPECHKLELRRLIGQTSFVLTGGGWTPRGS
jgi:putative FmdB family regulatory protein